jgi:hypothetical protein
LDGFVVEGRAYLVRSSGGYQAYLRTPNKPNIRDVAADRR